jgi:hypothetical protein
MFCGNAKIARARIESDSSLSSAASFRREEIFLRRFYRGKGKRVSHPIGLGRPAPVETKRRNRESCSPTGEREERKEFRFFSRETFRFSRDAREKRENRSRTDTPFLSGCSLHYYHSH